MDSQYTGVKTRFLNKEERFLLSDENEMPLVIEPVGATDVHFLQKFIRSHSSALLNDMAKYGAVLLRGFDVASDEDFEKTILSMPEFKGISEAFMSEEGRIHVGDLKYILHTNAVYKTGGTLYLGGFHSENFYNPDVPSYICFCCLTPSLTGGETGLVNMEKVYQQLNPPLKKRLEKNTFFVSKWLMNEVTKRYAISAEKVKKICQHFNLPITGKGDHEFVLMYKPSIFINPRTSKPSLQINLFELPALNRELRKEFMADYSGKEWFWHRFVWKIPQPIFKAIEKIYIACASFFYSPKDAINILLNKINTYRAEKKITYQQTKVGSCFSKQDTKELAQLIRKNYSSCLWKKGDILLIDNKKVAHAGMPGSGPRLIRAMICNPLEMNYSLLDSGHITCKERVGESIGHFMASNSDSSIAIDSSIEEKSPS